ncbi:MAG: ABC transporter ATP-binding protein [Desulfamplus sp.]|nr:ABC transporter ATP-binding protein [Desulfamplus sp.]
MTTDQIRINSTDTIDIKTDAIGIDSANTISINAQNLKKIYRRGSEEICAVNEVSLEIKKGEYVSFIGPSGSGKTTLINILGCLDNPSSGMLSIGQKKVFGEGKPLSEKLLTKIRRELFGYIFQKFYLIPTLTVIENVLLPCIFYKKEVADIKINGNNSDVAAMQRGAALLEMLGMENRMDHLPGQLSGGEMQRVAVARALINKPEILLADEPTGNLDSARSQEIGRLLRELNRKEQLTIILVTHNPELAKSADRIVELRDGRVFV